MVKKLVYIHLYLKLLENCRGKVVECSAKDDHNIKEIFKTLLSVSKYSAPASNDNSQTGLKRRSSAYVSASSSRNKNRTSSPAPIQENGEGSKLKPRSRSLIRRASRKNKQALSDTTADDCLIQ
uniref:Uncharacterized protein n=1 Tax=Megaselia scalaris TaxID=36166 RepID=T1GGB2_MEGSC